MFPFMPAAAAGMPVQIEHVNAEHAEANGDRESAERAADAK
jgi:hypothetical protein